MEIFGVTIIMDPISIGGLILGAVMVAVITAIACTSECKAGGCRKFCHRGYGK